MESGIIIQHSTLARPSSPPKAIPGNRITTVKDFNENLSSVLPNQTGSLTSRGFDRGGAKDRGGTGRQWQSTNADVEPITPVQMNETNKFLQLETSPQKVKHLAGLKNNSYSPPALQQKPAGRYYNHRNRQALIDRSILLSSSLIYSLCYLPRHSYSNSMSTP